MTLLSTQGIQTPPTMTFQGHRQVAMLMSKLRSDEVAASAIDKISLSLLQ
jgi:hypothetical protein